MSLKLYNTLSRQKEEFIPINKNEIKMYACGVTADDACHIGHARQAIVYDVIKKYLRYLEYKVTYVRNYTDVDDKIIKKAKMKNMDPIEYSNNMIISAEKGFADLGLENAEFLPKVSENIDTIINFIKVLIEKEYAYVTKNGDVYFSVKKFKDYGKLSNRNIDELEHGVRKEVDESKKDPLDFVLWKSENEISWESPWGHGRPGWHIECSAMSMKYLGESFDIHGGGIDLIFPHHENEIAQSESYSEKQFSKYWIHNGLITVDSQKMSKSLGNSITIRDVLNKYHREALVFSILQNHYQSNIDLGNTAFDMSEKRLYYFYQTLNSINKFIKGNEPNGEVLNVELVNSIEKDFKDAMNDNLNTSLAISNFSAIFKYANELLKKSKEKNSVSYTLKLVYEKIQKACSILGLLKEEPNIFLFHVKQKYIKLLNIDVNEVDKLLLERLNAKKEKNYILSDSIRKELDNKGIVIFDNADKSEWDIKVLY